MGRCDSRSTTSSRHTPRGIRSTARQWQWEIIPVDHHHNEYRENKLPNIHFPSILFRSSAWCSDSRKEDRMLLAEKAISVTNRERHHPSATCFHANRSGGWHAGGLSSERKCPPRKVPVRQVQSTLLESGNYLLPYLDVDKSDPFI